MADRSHHLGESPELAVEGHQWSDVGIRLRGLSDQLRAIADYEAETELRFRGTPSGLGTYRRAYHHWERVIAEFALAKMEYTQWDTAHFWSGSEHDQAMGTESPATGGRRVKEQRMIIFLGTIASFLLLLLPELLSQGRGTDRRLIAQNKVRCAIRAFDGRVLNIGTEWSIGVCEISSAHLRFIPSTGIVGDREIDVVGIRMMEGGPYERVVVPWGESTNVIVSTEGGELYWVVPEHIADEVITRLSPLTT